MKFDGSDPGFRGVVNDEEERVALRRADDVELHGSFGGRGHRFASASAHGSIGQLEALFAGEQKLSLRSGVFVRRHVGFRAEVGFGDDNFVARASGNRRERPPFAVRVRSQTFPAASTTALAGVAAPRPASVVGKFSKRQTRGPGGRVENLLHRRMARSVFGGAFPE